MSVAESDPQGQRQLAGFTQRLAELGWTTGTNLRMEVRRDPCHRRIPAGDRQHSDRIRDRH